MPDYPWLAITSSENDYINKWKIWYFEIHLWKNWDITIRIYYSNMDKYYDTTLIFVNSIEWWNINKIHEALSILTQIEENPSIKLQFTTFIEKASIEIEKWTLWIYYDENRKILKIEIHNTHKNWREEKEKIYIRIALEWAQNSTQELVLYTSQKIMHALANLQNVMKEEEKNK